MPKPPGTLWTLPADTPATSRGNATLLVAGGTLLDESVTLLDSLQPGESNRADWSTSIGGVACNVFCAAAPLTNASLISALGDDDIGQAIKFCLETSPLAARSSLAFKTSNELATGRYTAVLDKAGELVIGLANSHATDALQAEDILQAMAGQQDLQMLAVDTNLSTSCLQGICHYFRGSQGTNQRAGPDHGLGTVIGRSANQSSARLAAIAVSPVKCMRLADLGDCIDFLFLNRQEATMLTGLPSGSTPAQLSTALLAMHFSSHVLSDGAANVLVQEAGETHSLPVKTQASPSNHSGNGSETNSVNGAGDALAGATLALLCQGNSLVDSVREGGLAAAQSVLGGHRVLPWPASSATR